MGVATNPTSRRMKVGVRLGIESSSWNHLSARAMGTALRTARLTCLRQRRGAGIAFAEMCPHILGAGMRRLGSQATDFVH